MKPARVLILVQGLQAFVAERAIRASCSSGQSRVDARRNATHGMTNCGKPFGTVVTGFLAGFALSCSTGPQPGAAKGATFLEVRKIFERYCIRCHGAHDPEGELDLTEHHSILRGGESGAVVKPGDPAGSRLIDLVKGGEMPLGPRGPKPKTEIEILVRWVDAGANPTP